MNTLSLYFRPHALLLVCAWMLHGCGEPPTASGGDAGVAVGGSADAAVVDSRTVQPATPPSMAPCQEGWREVDLGRGIVCAPWPEEGMQECPPFEAHYPGTPGCQAIGDACPTGRWSETIPEGADVLYVAEGESGGDGSTATPFGTIDEALAIARPGQVVALSAGTYTDAATLLNGVTLWGACVGQTHLQSSPAAGGIINAIGPGNEVRNLRLSGISYALSIDEGAELEVHGVLSVDAAFSGVFVTTGAKLTGDDLVIRNTAPSPVSGNFGRGIEVVEGGSADLSQVVIEGNRGHGVFALNEGSSITLRNAAIFGTREQVSDGRGGRGVAAEDGSSITLEGCVIEDNRELGVYASQGSHVIVHDSIIGGTRMAEFNTDFTVGAQVQEQASLVMERVLVEDNEALGLLVINDGTTLSLTDVVVRDTIVRHDDSFAGRGVAVDIGGSIEVHRALVTGNTEGGMTINGGVSTLEDLQVVDTRSEVPTLVFGRGLSINEQAQVQAQRVELHGNREVALLVRDVGTNVMIDDLIITDTYSQEETGFFGRGLHAGVGGTAVINRALLERNTEVGISSAGGSSVTMTVVTIRDTRVRGCVATGECVGAGAGIGLLALQLGTASLRDFEISGSPIAGVAIANEGEVDLQDGEISDNLVGINVQIENYDLGRLTQDVRFMDNETRLDAITLSLPDPMLP